MTRCPQCGNDNEPGAAFCDMCGAKLPMAAPASAAPQPTPPPPPSAAPVMPPPAAPAAPAAALTCPNCHQPYLPGEAFCGECGAQLPAPGAAVAPAPQPAPAPVQPAPPPPQPPVASAGQMQCPACGTLFPAGQQFCDQDGTRLVPAAAEPVVVPPPVVAPPPVSFRPRLVVTDGGAELDLSGKVEFLVGRTDPPSNVFADIDLTPYKGEEGGVSRRHAIVRIAGDQVVIEDQNSTNFTYVNKQRLQPHVPQVLSDGDEIRMGRVVLHYRAS